MMTRQSHIALIWLRRAALTAIVALIVVLSLSSRPTVAQEDHSDLTRASFRRNCLLCHSSALPEGVSPEILAGLHASSPGIKPRDEMPGIVCQRRCDACRVPESHAGQPSPADGKHQTNDPARPDG